MERLIFYCSHDDRAWDVMSVSPEDFFHSWRRGQYFLPAELAAKC